MASRKIEKLIKQLKDSDSTTRFEAAQALGESGDEAAVEPLIEALRDREHTIRSAAARSLGEIGDARAVKPLIAALKDRSMGVQYAASDALEEMGPPAIDPLIDALNDYYLDVRGFVLGALTEITGEDFGQDAAAWRSWWNENKSS